MIDVAVIGGGLAGLTAALALHAQGHTVALFESGDYPRHRVCGEFLSPECAAALESLGLGGTFRAHRPAHITKTLVTSPSGLRWMADLPAPAHGLSRFALDALMADAAATRGIVVHAHTTVTDVRGSLTRGFTLATNGPTRESTAQVVIAAHGKRSRLDHTLERPFMRQQASFVGLKMHFDGPSTADRVELHTFPGGYCGLSHIEDGVVNLCLLSQAEPLHRAGSIPEFVRWMRSHNPALNQWMANAIERLPRWQAIAQVSFASKSPVEGDILMTGDAAGLISPLAGDGMGMAFDGGLLAAYHVNTYLRGKVTVEMLKGNYAAAWSRQFRRRLRMGQVLQAFLLRPAALDFGLTALNAAPPLGKFFIAHTRA